MDHNPNLGPWTWPVDIDPAGQKTLDKSNDIGNIVWQNRPAPPTDYENALGDALEKVFETGAVELADVIARLNELGIKSPQGTAWTEDSFARAMKKLGE